MKLRKQLAITGILSVVVFTILYILYYQVSVQASIFNGNTAFPGRYAVNTINFAPVIDASGMTNTHCSNTGSIAEVLLYINNVPLDATVDTANSYAIVRVVSGEFSGRQQKTAFSYVKIPEGEVSDVNNAYVFGIDNALGYVMSGQQGVTLGDRCTVSYHIEFSQPASCTPSTICGEWSMCSGGSQSRTCDSGCGQTNTDTRSCVVGNPPPVVNPPNCPQVAEPACQFYERPFVQKDLAGCTVVSTCQTDQDKVGLILGMVIVLAALMVVYIIVTRRKK